MYVPDLSVRPGHLVGSEVPRERLLTYVGWLAGNHPFPTGPIDPPVLDRLVYLTRDTRELTRGKHWCDFCPPAMRHELNFTYADVELWLGSGESLLPGKGDTLYTFPDLICHYVIEHGYLPPQEFLDAIMAAPPAAVRTASPGAGAPRVPSAS